MPKYVIERVVPGASKLSPAELKTLSQRSCNVLNELGPQIQWVQSYVTDNKLYCIYRAPNEEIVREHAQRGGFPCNKVSEVRTMIDPTTAE
jgi:hypothetical protein